MLNKRTILFFTDTYNKTVAENVAEEIADDNDAVAVIVTKKELKSAASNYIVKKLFPEGSARRLSAYNTRVRFKSVNMEKKPRKKLALPAHKNIRKRILNALHRYNPSVVAVTDYSVMKDLFEAIDKYGKEIKVAVIPDEYILDKRLINSMVNYYFVDNLDMRNALVDNGVPDEKVVICGLPVGREFLTRKTEGAKVKFALTDGIPTLLVSASRAGDWRFRKVLETIKNADLDMNVIAACGKSRKFLNYARSLGFNAYADGIDMNAALDACDAVVTRPTTLLMAEAIAKGKDVYALYPEGKMEKATLDYLGIDSVTKVDDLDGLVKNLKEFAEFYSEMPPADDSPVEIVTSEEERSSVLIAKNLLSLATVTKGE